MSYKLPLHYQVEYKLINVGSINRGEIGGYVSIKKFEDLDDAKAFIKKYKNYPCNYEFLPEDTLVFQFPPKLWEMKMRGYKEHIEKWYPNGRIPKNKWIHTEGDIYEIHYEHFDLKERVMSYSCQKYEKLEDALKNLKIKDSKRFLASDFTFYSKSELSI